MASRKSSTETSETPQRIRLKLFGVGGAGGNAVNQIAGTMTGVEVVMFMLDHTTHHRASAEMYLRAKGITPTEYEF